MDFVGAKAAFFSGDAVLVYLRDDHPGLSWAGHWDLPGGGREPDEGPEHCLLRELEEEFGLRLPLERLIWKGIFPAMQDPSLASVFFAGQLTKAEIAAIRFGDEGLRWEVMPVTRFLAHDRAVPEMQRRVGIVWADW